MTRLLILLSLCSMACSARADDTWRVSTGLTYAYEKPAADTKTAAVTATADLHASPMPLTGDYPLAEAQFVERMSSVGLRYDRGGHKERNNVAQADLEGHGVRAVLMHPELDFHGAIGVHRQELDPALVVNSLSVSYLLTSNYTTKFADLGYFLAKTLQVTLGYSETRAVIDSLGSSTLIYERYTSLSARYLGSLSGGAWYAIDSNVTRTNVEGVHGSEVGLQGTYYFNRRHGLALDLVRSNANAPQGKGMTYGLSLRSFLTPRISLLASHVRLDPAATGEYNQRLWRLGVEGRF